MATRQAEPDRSKAGKRVALPATVGGEASDPRANARIEIGEAARADVRRFAEIGVPHIVIARILGVSVSTLRRRCRAELDAGVEVANARIALTLFETAMAGNTTAMLWWEKTRAGRKELAGGDPPGIGARCGDGLITPGASARDAAERYREELG